MRSPILLRAALLATALLAAGPALAVAGTVGPGGDPAGPLNRYYSDSASVYLVTAQRALEPFTLQKTLGFVLGAPGAGRHALYQCSQPSGRLFLSGDAGCEGASLVRLEGYLLDAPTADALAVYRCSSAAHGYPASTDGTGCEGLGSVEGVLGYAPQRQSALNRYNTVGGEHWITARAVTPSYGFEGTLGYVLDAPGPDHVALYGCLSGSDHFVSEDSGCGGAQSVGPEGYLLSASHGAATRAIYECAAGGDRFTSLDPGCEGQQGLGQLGYVLANPVDADLDGAGAASDCNDADAAIHPGAIDVPDDGIDQDCSGADAVDLDRDRDGVTRPTDCNDADAAIHPGATDIPHDRIDQNCDGRDAPYPTLATRISGFFTTRRGAAATRFTSLHLRGAVKGQTVEVRCSGKGCPHRHVTRTKVGHSKASLSILGKLGHAWLRRGAAVEVRVTASRTIGRAAHWSIRAPASPKRVDRCLSPGAKKAAVCRH